MILKSYIIEKDINHLNDFWSVLFYGENIGIQTDFKEDIKKKNNDAEVINFFQDEITKNNNILIDEINNTSLFSSKKIIYINEASDKIFQYISEYLDKKISNIKIYVFANLLDKRSKLRAAYEKNKTLATVPCYADNEISLRNYIKDKLLGYQGLSPEIINLIMNNSNLDRSVVSTEIIKIKNYFGKKNIKLNKLEQLLNTNSNASFDVMRDAILMGEKTIVNRLMGEIEFNTDENFYYLNSIAMRVNKLLSIKYINQDYNNIEQSIENFKPKIFWKDKPIFILQLRKWNVTRLQKALKDIGEIEFLMKSNSQIRNDVLIKNLIINLCNEVANS